MRARQGLCVDGCGGDDYALDLEKEEQCFFLYFTKKCGILLMTKALYAQTGLLTLI